jgi:hypothetical protein
MLKVNDLKESIAFYSALFGVPPTKQKKDYAKWLIDDPKVNFSIAEKPKETIGIEHLGIQAESEAELNELYRNVSNARGSVREEGDTICCYSKSKKSWIKDPSGIEWEMFYTSGEVNQYYSDVDSERT